jgi:predicted P-loop ATPase
MDELRAALTAAGLGHLSPTPGFSYDEAKGEWLCFWEVRDDYETLIHTEAKWCGASGIGDWHKTEGEASALPSALQEKIVKARGEARTKIAAGLGATEIEVIEPEERDDEFIPVPEEISKAWDSLELATTASGTPVMNVDNALRVLEGIERFQDRIWFDEFSNSIFTTFGCAPGAEREWTDHDTRGLWIEYQRRLGLSRMGQDSVLHAVAQYAFQHRRHPVKEWLAAQAWDRAPRLDTFLRDYMGADDSAFTRAISANFFVSMLARIYNPGCKVDNMIVLEGDQGAKKSSALKALIGPKWFTECNEPISNGNNKDFYAVLQGKMLVEIAELDSFSRADIKRIKAIVTTASDRYRPAYGRIAQTFPRTSVFVGTTNEDEYLEDATGGRRFWPVRVGKIRMEEIERDRSQLFAEALHRYKAKPVWWEIPTLEAAAAQEARRKIDGWEEAVARWLELDAKAPKMPDAEEPLTIGRVAKEALDIEPVRVDRMVQIRVAYCLKVLGYRPRATRVRGVGVKIWEKK